MAGQCVRLRKGRAEEKTVFSDDPARTAREFEAAGAWPILVIDLDGAFDGVPTRKSMTPQGIAASSSSFAVR